MIQENLNIVQSRIAEAAKRVKREPNSIKLVCVTKTASTTQIKEAIRAGITDIGENRVQDAIAKYRELASEGQKQAWHMIGHLQTNKVKKALEIFDVFHSVDSIRLAEEIDKKAKALGKKAECLIEVNTSNEDSKFGINQEEAELFVRQISHLENIQITGLMTMAPLVDDPELARPSFTRLRRLRDMLRSCNIANTDIKELSMGMTQDFEVAIEEGATIVRIGTAIFNG
jgi:hypothetical protein